MALGDVASDKAMELIMHGLLIPPVAIWDGRFRMLAEPFWKDVGGVGLRYRDRDNRMCSSFENAGVVLDLPTTGGRTILLP